MLKKWRLDHEYRVLCAADFASDARISSAASLLALSRAGVVIDNASIDAVVDTLGTFAEEHQLSPEEVQAALVCNEPVLQFGIGETHV